ncbi:MAG TPA: DUF2760 domain-containing protein [Myxococcales bacterium]|jgi:uncharacterized protein DUF2760|nr:DUF2760 domain-containing protein [Myxococcales bacterium]
MHESTPPSFFPRLWLAVVCLFRVIFDPPFAARVAAARQDLDRGPQRPALAGPLPEGTLHLIALLQREGRLLDFCEEDVAKYSDAEVGAAARTVHAGCRKVLRSALALEPVRAEAEGAQVQVPPGFDPGAVRLTGNVIGNPPFTGTLRHHGWKAREVRLPPPPAGQDATMLAPAEVELP